MIQLVDIKNLRETQLYELELLKKFKEICDAEGFKYYLVGGTAIGAVRHNGFIPWDDDIDVALLRDDYDRFISVSQKYLRPGQEVLHYSINSDYQDSSMKLIDKRICFRMKTDTSIIEQNIWIDIFPLDGTKKVPFAQKFHYYHIYFLRMLLAYYYLEKIQFNSERSRWKKTLITIAQRVPVNRLIKPEKVRIKIDRLLRNTRVDKQGNIGNYLGAYGLREFVPYDFFGNGSFRVFEDEYFTLPAKVEEYLTNIYGDYMVLPPVDKQVPRHSVLEIIVNTIQD